MKAEVKSMPDQHVVYVRELRHYRAVICEQVFT